jgi:hypothetical protein
MSPCTADLSHRKAASAGIFATAAVFRYIKNGDCR